MSVETHDAYKPAEIAALIETAGVAKAALPFHRMATLAMLAGAFIGFGAAFWCMAMVGADPDPGFGPQRVLGGAAFALGLILVVVGGAELFTGNALMVMAVAVCPDPSRTGGKLSPISPGWSPRADLSPTPNCPLSLSPQHRTLPSSRSAQFE